MFQLSMVRDRRPRAVPVTMGSARFRTLELADLRLTEAWFPAGAYLAPHIHDRPCFAVMLEGSFDTSFRTVTHPCPPMSVHTEPLAERHANRIGARGAHVVVVQPDPAQDRLFRPLRPLLERISQRRHAGVTALAARIVAELDRPDSVASLAAEGLALEMLTEAMRAAEPRPARAPAWLTRAQEYLHAHCFEPLRIAEIAAAAGVHPAHVARTFRRQLRTTVAEYVRRLRLEWAVTQLQDTETPLSAIALRAGFADQSHFTRAFKQYLRVTPGRYRATRTGFRDAPAGCPR